MIIKKVKLLFLSLLPIFGCIFLLFWLESNGILTSEFDHRGKLSVFTLSIGLMGSLMVYSFLSKK